MNLHFQVPKLSLKDPALALISTIIVKFIYYEKATKFCKIFTLLLSYVVPVKSKVKISQNFVAFSEYMNFTYVLTTMIVEIKANAGSFNPIPTSYGLNQPI